MKMVPAAALLVGYVSINLMVRDGPVSRTYFGALERGKTKRNLPNSISALKMGLNWQLGQGLRRLGQKRPALQSFAPMINLKMTARSPVLFAGYYGCLTRILLYVTHVTYGSP
jgi:hypothetical protein